MITMVDASIMTDLSVTIPIPIFDLIPKSHFVLDKVTLAEGTENFALSDLSGLRTLNCGNLLASNSFTEKNVPLEPFIHIGHRVECHHPTQGDFPNQLAMANLWIGGCGTLATNHRKLYAVLPWFAGAPILAEFFFYYNWSRGMLQRWKNRKDN